MCHNNFSLISFQWIFMTKINWRLFRRTSFLHPFHGENDETWKSSWKELIRLYRKSIDILNKQRKTAVKVCKICYSSSSFPWYEVKQKRFKFPKWKTKHSKLQRAKELKSKFFLSKTEQFSVKHWTITKKDTITHKSKYAICDKVSFILRMHLNWN